MSQGPITGQIPALSPWTSIYDILCQEFAMVERDERIIMDILDFLKIDSNQAIGEWLKGRADV